MYISASAYFYNDDDDTDDHSFEGGTSSVQDPVLGFSSTIIHGCDDQHRLTVIPLM